MQHKSKETGGHVRLIISILVTFTAVVLGLVISNVKSSYDQFESRMNAFAGDITELDIRPREYGDEAAPIRAQLRTYLAAAIADTWRNEPPPSGAYPKFSPSPGLERRELGDLLIDADMAIGKFDTSDLFRKRLVTQIENQMSATMTQRAGFCSGSLATRSPESSRRYDRVARDRFRCVRRYRASQCGGLCDHPVVRALLFVRDLLHP